MQIFSTCGTRTWRRRMIVCRGSLVFQLLTQSWVGIHGSSSISWEPNQNIYSLSDQTDHNEKMALEWNLKPQNKIAIPWSSEDDSDFPLWIWGSCGFCVTRLAGATAGMFGAALGVAELGLDSGRPPIAPPPPAHWSRTLAWTRLGITGELWHRIICSVDISMEPIHGHWARG